MLKSSQIYEIVGLGAYKKVITETTDFSESVPMWVCKKAMSKVYTCMSEICENALDTDAWSRFISNYLRVQDMLDEDGEDSPIRIELTNSNSQEYRSIIIGGWENAIKDFFYGYEIYAYFLVCLREELVIFESTPVIETQSTTTTTTESKGKNSMMNIKGFEFGVVGNESVRLSHLGMAVKNNDGVFVAYNSADSSITDVDCIDLGIEDMIYKMPASLAEVSRGDVIIHGGHYVFVKEVSDTLRVVDISVGEEKVVHPTKSIFGFNFVTKITPMIDFKALTGSADESNPFGAMMPLLLMSGMGKNSDGSKKGGMSSLLPLMMMGGMNGGQGGTSALTSNPMLMMMMMNGDSDMGSMLPLMMITQGGGLFAPPKAKEEVVED